MQRFNSRLAQNDRSAEIRPGSHSDARAPCCRGLPYRPVHSLRLTLISTADEKQIAVSAGECCPIVHGSCATTYGLWFYCRSSACSASFQTELLIFFLTSCPAAHSGIATSRRRAETVAWQLKPSRRYTRLRRIRIRIWPLNAVLICCDCIASERKERSLHRHRCPCYKHPERPAAVTRKMGHDVRVSRHRGWSEPLFRSRP